MFSKDFVLGLSLGEDEALSAIRSEDCDFCRNAHTCYLLAHDNDLSYKSIGKVDDEYRLYLRTGNDRPTSLLFEHGNELVGFYRPKFCPECGRKLYENERFKPPV